jgi:hypothetical protein
MVPPLSSDEWLALNAGSYARAQIAHVAHGSPKATGAEIGQRLAVCQACEHFCKGVCQECGCRCNRSRSSLMNKLVMADQECPLGKWRALWPR